MESNPEQENFMYVRSALGILRRYWYFFALATIFFLGLAVFLNWYQEPLYEVSATILIDENGSPVPDPSKEFMKSFSIFTPVSDIQREILKMKSSEMIFAALRKTNSEISYSVGKSFIKRELYSDLPFVVELFKKHVQPVDVSFQILPTSGDKYLLIMSPTKEPVRLYDYSANRIQDLAGPLSLRKEFSSGDTVTTSFMSLKIVVDKYHLSSFAPGFKFFFILNDLNALTYEFQQSLHIEQVSKDIQAAAIKLKVKNPKKGTDFINALTAAYVQRNLDKKNSVAETTIHYLDNQLGILEDSLKQAEARLQGFRSENRVMQMELKTDQVFKGTHELQIKKEELESKLKSYRLILENLETKNDRADLQVPTSIGANDMVLTELINKYIELNTERNNLIEKRLTASPAFATRTIELDVQKKALIKDIRNLINASNTDLASTEDLLGKGNAEEKALPNTERQLVGIERKYRLNDNLVNYMLEKKAEAQVAKASNLPKNDILEPARLTQLNPVSPNKTLNLLIALILGIGFPFATIGIRRAFNSRVDEDHMPGEINRLPFIGSIYRTHKKKESLILLDAPNSVISESIRGVRTNLDYLLSGRHNQVILLTSTKPDEGKSFNSLNLAISLSLLGRKTILLDCDLRKPNLYRSLELTNTLGVSSVLKGTSTLDEVIIQTGISCFDFIPAGPVPLHPAELIDSAETGSIISRLKERYDYIILDTPPVGLVSEALILMKHADLKILVVRQRMTPKKELVAVLKDLESRKMENICWLLNDVEVGDTVSSGKNKYFSRH
jgi:tyrosine-protein kinase Etk/Wzc